ncbi:unnamed protein product [Rotaria sordida]|uniref:Metalloendopeptidase n=1 Tax=Rotaria sordida TaxID=392033 RepID=A0A815GN05_9BILA|nr:unnamed protein product [Rotaria sordida]CAF1341105.1 unnamed protein product [Rotaria sordida]
MKAVIFTIVQLWIVLLIDAKPLNILVSRPLRYVVKPIDRNGISPENLGRALRDDILVPGPKSNVMNRGVAYNFANKWPYGIVPYDMSPITNSGDRDMIRNAMDWVVYDTGSPIAGSDSRAPCVYFRPREAGDETFLTIRYGQGCNAHMGYWQNFGLTMTLQKDNEANCFHSGTIKHELIHVLGFDHEQNRPDRDNYVTINYGNIDSEWHYAFEKSTWGKTAVDLGTSYDYSSIMHYGRDYFSNNGQPTIVPKQANAPIGSSDDLSPTDIVEVRRFYGCPA